MKKIDRYLNPVAQLFLINKAPYNVLVAGRGFSKSFGNGLNQANKMALMPRSCGLFSSPTYSMIYSKTLIPMKAAWEQHMGYIEGIHYVVGKVPPKHFEKPYHRPHKFENVLTWWNGRTVVFGSFDRPSLISGGSYDDSDLDEAYLIEKNEYDDFVIPTMRGTHPRFKDVDVHLQQRFTSSMPYKNQGDWLLDFRVKALANPEMYNFIGWEPNVKVQKGSTYMNVNVLGRKAIEQMLAEMNEYSAKVMIHNQQVTNWGNTFYPALAPRHWYTPRANEKVVSMPLGKDFKRDASYDESADDYNPNMPIHVSHDWGAFNCITIDQEYPKELRFINSMHVQHPKTIDDLADQFIEYYRMHKAKLVYQWGDKSGKNRMANAKLTFFEQFATRLRDKGWTVVRKKVGDVEQFERHRFITNLHKEEDDRLPKVRHNSKLKDLQVSIESTGMKDHGKDKSSEHNPSIKPEHATHYSDAYDYRLYHGLINREKKYPILDPYSTSLG